MIQEIMHITITVFKNSIFETENWFIKTDYNLMLYYVERKSIGETSE